MLASPCAAGPEGPAAQSHTSDGSAAGDLDRKHLAHRDPMHAGVEIVFDLEYFHCIHRLGFDGRGQTCVSHQ